MTKRNLKNGEMLAVSAALLDERRHRSLFVSTPLMAALLTEVEGAHGGLVAAAPAPDAEGEAAARELSALGAEGRRLDQTHDRKAIGIHVVLEGAERLADDPADAERFARVREAIFPDGTAVVTLTWLAEAGEVERVDALLADEGVRAVLASVVVRAGVTLLDEVRAYVAAGRALGLVESRKVALNNTEAAPAANGRGAAVSARNEWIQTINLVVTTAKRLRGAEAARFAPALREIEGAEARADARAARAASNDADAAKDGSDDEGDAPAEDATPAGDVPRAKTG